MIINFDFDSECSPRTVSLAPGKYLMETWGASGGGVGNHKGGRGGYTGGLIHLTLPTTFYVFVGGQGSDPVKGQTSNGGCNGGGTGGKGRIVQGEYYNSGGGGGGATDIRVSLDINDRIIIAGGGGGNCGGHGPGG